MHYIETVPKFISDCCSAPVVALAKDTAACTHCSEVCEVIDTDN